MHGFCGRRRSTGATPRRRSDCCAARISLGAWIVGAAIVGVIAPPAPLAFGQTAEAKPTYFRQPTFFIPYQASPQSPLAAQVAKVQLLASLPSAPAWAVLEEAEASVRGFSYRAPADGEYAFTL